MRGAGAELGVLLTGNAVNYVAADQDASGLTLGTWRQTQPPTLAQDLAALIRKDVPIYCVKEDLAERGLLEGKLLEGIVLMSRDADAAAVRRVRPGLALVTPTA